MFDQMTFDRIGEGVGKVLIKWLTPKLEAFAPKQWPRWMSVETAGEYIDKTYEGMRSTLKAFPKEFQVSMIGDLPRIDKNDIDKFFLNGKGKK